MLNVKKNTQNSFSIKAKNVYSDDVINEVDDANLREELRSCQHFSLDSELELARHKFFNYAIKNINAKLLVGKLDQFFNHLKCAAKLNLCFGFVSEKYRRWGHKKTLRTQKHYLAGSIQTCVHQRRLGETKRYSQQN